MEDEFLSSGSESDEDFLLDDTAREESEQLSGPFQPSASAAVSKATGATGGNSSSGNGAVPGAGEGDEELSKKQVRNHFYRLYGSHFFSAWGDRMWEFAIALFLLEIWKDSLLLTAIYGFVMAAVIVIFGAPVGYLVDTRPRLFTVRTSLAVQNVAVASCVACILILKKTSHDSPGFWPVYTVLLLAACVGTLANTATNLSVEKDWVAVICAGDKELLGNTNSTLRRIDLSCKILAPIMIGFVMTFGGVTGGAFFIIGWNLVFWLPEYRLLTTVYSSFPALARLEVPKEKRKRKITDLMLKHFVSLKRGWTLYRAQPTFLPGIAFCLIYCTALSFGSIMTGYTYWRGVSEALLGGLRGIGALFGIISTFIYPVVMKRLGVEKTGLYSIWAQLVCLVPCVIAMFIPHTNDGNCTKLAPPHDKDCESYRNESLAFLIGGVIVSRLGLWMFDLSITTLLQTRIQLSDDEGTNTLATINGVQTSLNMLLQQLGYVMGIIFHKPEQFVIQVFVSFCFVAAAALLYTFWAIRDARATASGFKTLVNESETEDDDDDVKLLGTEGDAPAAAADSLDEDDDDDILG